MKKFLAIIALLVFIIGCSSPPPAEDMSKHSQDVKFRCASNNDCTSTCGFGCVNAKWAESYKDTCVNIRAFDCSCQSNVCHTDGKAPKN